MKKAWLALAVAAVLALSLGGTASAAVPGDFTLGINAGYPYLLTELELEYKYGPWAGGLDTAWIGNGMEISIFGRYYVPLGLGFDFYAAVNPGLVMLFYTSPATLVGTIKAGPGFDYRWKHLRVGLEGGILYRFGAPSPNFYLKLGLGYIF
ncbi:MAG: hypothetical protein KBB09_02365 [Firmicutes bacterium]|nr:hypothetical protein [Bacillota bacterium]